MAYIGNTQQNQNYVPAIDYFSGNGSTTAFTLSRPVASVAQVQAVIENVPQNPGDAYTVSGNTITFTSAPPSGTNNIYIYYTSPNTQVVQPGQGTVGTIQMADGVTVNFNDGSAAAPSITNTGDTNTGMFFPAADTIAFSEGGVEAMRLDASGNVGIGTSSPTNKLDVNGSGRFYGTYTENTSNIGAYVGYVNNTPRIGFFNGTPSENWQIDNASGNFRWFTPGLEQMIIMANGNLKFNSGYGSAAVAYGCRAWVNFNGTGTVAIRASGNVTSITDNATGQYTVNFTNAMPDANYSATGGASSSNCEAVIRFYGYQTGTLAVGIVDSNAPAFTDDSAISVAVFR